MNEKWQVSFEYGPSSMFSKNTHFVECSNENEAKNIYNRLNGTGETRQTTNRGYGILFQCNKIQNLQIEHFGVKPKKENKTSGWSTW